MHKKPLQAIRVLEIGAYISAPYAGSLLASLGAEVVKIEPPRGEDFRRGMGVESPYFVQYNAGKKSVAIDLKTAEGVELVKRLLPNFDVVIENMRPGKIGALGLDAEVCRTINPNIVFSSVSGFGSGGPLSQRPAYDTMGQSYGGIYSIMNDPDEARLTGTCIADLITGVSATMGILAGLVGRLSSESQSGTVVETSLMEAVSLLTIDAMTQAGETDSDPTRESRHPQAQNFCLNTASGGAITLHLSSSEKFWENLVRAVGREELLDDVRFHRYADRMKVDHYKQLVVLLEEEFLKRSRTEWEEILLAADVPHAPVLAVSEVVSHPQTQWLGLIDQLPSGAPLVRSPWRFNNARPERSTEAPHVGEHTFDVLGEVCASSELDKLVAQGVVRVHHSVPAGAVVD